MPIRSDKLKQAAADTTVVAAECPSSPYLSGNCLVSCLRGASYGACPTAPGQRWPIEHELIDPRSVHASAPSIHILVNRA